MNLRPRFAAGVAALILAAGVVPAGAATIRDVRVRAEGAAPVDEAFVLAHVGARPGQTFDPNAVSRDVRSLKDTGRYSYVGAEVETAGEDVILVFAVESRLRIRRLNIQGARYYSNRKIRELLALGVGDLVDEPTLAVHVNQVKDAYRKKYFPDVEVDYTLAAEPERGTADVTLVIDEGARVKVRRIDFPGARHAPPRTLRKSMAQKTVNLWSWLTGRGALDSDTLEADRLVLRQTFQDLGYLDAEIGEPRVESGRGNRVTIAIPVEEGPLYAVGAVDITGVTLFPKEEVARVLRIARGDLGEMSAIENSRQNIRDYYGSRGYINTGVAVQLDADADTGVVNVVYRVEEGRQARIRNIEIRGNTRTRDKVIRRELSVFPGEVFNEVRVRQSERVLRNLGFFSYVAASPLPTPQEDEFDLVFDVEEQRSGQFMVGAGFSSVDDLIGYLELSQGNFDIAGWPSLTGAGQKFKIRLTAGTERRDWEVSFVEPWFLDRRLSLGFDLFQHDRRFLSDDYDQRNTGGRVSLTQPLPGPYRLRYAYSLQEIEVRNVDEDASEIIHEEAGSRTKSAGEITLIRDTRDSVFIPTRGNRTTAGATLAGGPFAGETDLYELELRTAQYVPLWWDHVLSLRGILTTVEEYGDADRVPLFDRLFLGGTYTLRGFKYREVGPKDENGEPIGGRSQGFASVEYTIPLVEKIRAAVFYDAGVVSEDAYSLDTADYNSDWGVGIRFDIPGFPLQFDYAWPLEADEFNDRSSGRFNFVIGYQR